MWKRYGSIAALVLVIYILFRYMLGLVLPFVIAGVVAIVYYPVLRHLYGDTAMWNGRRKKLLLVISLILLYGSILLFIGLFGGGAIRQGQSIILNMPFYQARALCLIKNCCGKVDVMLKMADGDSFAHLTSLTDMLLGNSISAMIPGITSLSVKMAGNMFRRMFEVLITIIATFFIINDYEDIRSSLVTSEMGRAFCRVVTKCRSVLGTYLKAQGAIMLLDGTLCTAAFYIAGQPYYMTLGMLVALIDALPVLGAGAVLIPYSVILFIYGEIKKGLILIAAYGGCVIIRQVTEPKMVGNHIGVRPLYTIFAMYVGYRLLGVFGFLLGPIAMLVGIEVYREMREWIKKAGYKK